MERRFKICRKDLYIILVKIVYHRDFYYILINRGQVWNTGYQ